MIEWVRVELNTVVVATSERPGPDGPDGAEEDTAARVGPPGRPGPARPEPLAWNRPAPGPLVRGPPVPGRLPTDGRGPTGRCAAPERGRSVPGAWGGTGPDDVGRWGGRGF